MIASLRRWMFNKALENHPNYNSQIDKTFENPCNTVAIFGDSTLEENRSIIEQYANSLRKANKTVDVLYYSDSSNDVEEGYSKKNVKWNSIPESSTIDEFLNKNYDILICLLPEIEMHHNFVISLTKAQLKVGIIQEEGDTLFDLMIDNQERGNLPSFISQVNNNLEMISYR